MSKKLHEVQQEVERRIKQQTYKESAEKVQPVVDHVTSQIQDVANMVEEAVLELIVRIQEITGGPLFKRPVKLQRT